MNHTKHRKDLLFVAGILVFAAVLWISMQVYRSRYTGTIRIEADGKLYGTYALSQNQTVSINGTNVCEIKNGTAKMIEADCPDHLCMHQKPIDRSGGMIVCLPNKVIIEGVE